jgi:ribonuclease HI
MKDKESVKERYLRKYGKYLRGDFSGLPPIESKVEDLESVRRSTSASQENKSAITAFFDGLCEPRNPRGVACYGYVIYSGGSKVGDGSGLACEPWSWQASNNVAEYQALTKALEWLIEHNLQEASLVVKGDSQLVINQMQGSYAVNAARLIPLHRAVRKLTERFRELSFEWVPREENEEADLLSEKAYADYMAERANMEAKAIPPSKVSKLPDGRFSVQRSIVNLANGKCSCAQSRLHELRLRVKVPCRHIIAAQAKAVTTGRPVQETG